MHQKYFCNYFLLFHFPKTKNIFLWSAYPGQPQCIPFHLYRAFFINSLLEPAIHQLSCTHSDFIKMAQYYHTVITEYMHQKYFCNYIFTFSFFHFFTFFIFINFHFHIFIFTFFIFQKQKYIFAASQPRPTLI